MIVLFCPLFSGVTWMSPSDIITFGYLLYYTTGSNLIFTANTVQRQTAVTAYCQVTSYCCLPSWLGFNAVQRQTAVTAYISSTNLLLFALAWQCCGL